MGLQAAVRWLLPREDHFYDFLERQAEVAFEGSKALVAFVDRGSSAEAVSVAVQEWEHAGDKVVHDLDDALAKTFVTPIDREDIKELSTELDNVLDLVNAAIRACVLAGVAEPTEPMRALIRLVLSATEKLGQAVPKLRKHAYEDITRTTHELRRIEKEGDAVYRKALAALLTGEGVDAKQVIREKLVLDDLEAALDQCDAAAETLGRLAVKHG